MKQAQNIPKIRRVRYSGIGTLKLYNGYVKLKVKQTHNARWNRSTLDTSGKYMKIYRKSGNTKMDNIDL